MDVYESQLAELQRQQRELEERMRAELAAERGRAELMASTYGAAASGGGGVGGVRAASASGGGGRGGRPWSAASATTSTSRSKLAPFTSAAQEAAAATATAAADAAEKGPQNGQPVPQTRADMLRRYFDAMSEFPDYNERRESRLRDVKPFTFEQREAQRAKSTKARRMDALREEAERRVQETRNFRFHANPVPPTTYLHKYELMVQEWCARKEAIRVVAEQRAMRIKELAAPGREAAEALQMQKEAQQHHRPRAQSAHEPRRFPAFVAKEIPIDCKVRKWDALRLAEEERRQRIKFRAEQLLHFAKRPPRMEAETRAALEKNKQVDKALKDRKTAVKQLQQSNPNFTFKPRVDASVPDYEYLWAKERVEMAKRKQAKAPTVPVEFPLRETRSTVARIETEMRREASEGVETRWPYKSSRAKVKPTPPPRATSPTSPVQRPAATKAHAIHCEVVYRTIEERAAAEERERKEAEARRQREAEVRKRVAPLVGRSTAAVHRETIDKKVAEKKAALRASSKEAREKLDEIRRRVADKPPLFMEPTYLDQVAKARATTEEQVMAMLRQHGLAEATLSAVMARDGGGYEHVTASDVDPSVAGATSTDRVDARSLVAPMAATTHAAPLSQQPAAAAASTSAAAPGASAAPGGKKEAAAAAKKKRRGSDSSVSSSDSFESDSSASSA